jgi:hypothetical protein
MVGLVGRSERSEKGEKGEKDDNLQWGKGLEEVGEVLQKPDALRRFCPPDVLTYLQTEKT